MESLIQKIVSKLEQSSSTIAIEGNGISVTNAELLQKSRDYAYGISQKGVEDSWIGISTNLGWEVYSAILACWITGNGYVPIHSDFPKSRVRQIVSQTNLEYCIGNSFVKEISPSKGFKENIKKGQKAYLMFTSGTTGVPKGVPISQGNLEAFANHYLHHKNIKFTAQDKFLQSYELTFDVSVFCFLMPFLVGGTLVIPQKTKVKNLGLFKAIQEYDVTVTSFVPSVIRLTKELLPRVEFPKLRYSFFSGEPLIGDWAKVWMQSVPNAEVYNCYGPTETVIVCTEELLNDLDDTYFNTDYPLPLGKKFKGINLKIIDREIVFSGTQTFGGYLNQESVSLYYSGDLAHYDKNGKLIFEGRKDNQIQWNGYRIELDEIDRVLSNQSPGWIKTVFFKKEVKLIVFTNQDKEQIQTLIKNSFPDYYKPSLVFQIKDLPLNINGKLDLAKLKTKVFFDESSTQ